MTPDEFEQSLKRLGWKQADFCKMAGVEKTTPVRWKKGQTPIPGWASKFLEMAEEIKRLSRVIEPKK